MAKTNPFAAFAVKTEKVVLESLDGYEATIRALTKDESDDFNARMISGYSSDGKPDLNMDETWKISLEKTALVLVDPAVTVEQLKGFDSEKVNSLIAEISKVTSKDVDDTIDEEGN